MGMVRDDDSISLSLSIFSFFFLHVSLLYSLILSYALSYLDDDDNDCQRIHHLNKQRKVHRYLCSIRRVIYMARVFLIASQLTPYSDCNGHSLPMFTCTMAREAG